LAAAGLVAGAAGMFAIARSTEPPAIAAREPTVHRLTFQRGAIQSARFAPDGKTVIYSARWGNGPPRIETTRDGIFDSRAIDIGVGELLAISHDGDLAIQVDIDRRSVWQ